ncbi:MAG: HDIG domain-containing protein [Clostridiales bacterium]|nr:HDIG domain-containing protein [Clostridiales bacterium]
MTVSSKAAKAIRIVLVSLFVPALIAVVYLGSIPQRHNLSVGSISDVDITAQRSVVDTYETNKKASQAVEAVESIFIRSDDLADESVNRIYRLFDICSELRDNNISEDGTYIDSSRTLSNRLITEVRETFAIDLTDDEAFQLVTAGDNLYAEIRGKATILAETIMEEDVDDERLNELIEQKTSTIVGTNDTYYVSVQEIIRSLLSQLLIPNIELDESATEAARDAAYQTAMNNPVMIEKGLRIINVGEVVSEQDYSVLKDLDLLETNQFDYQLLLSIIFYMLVVFAVLVLFLSQSKSDVLSNPKDFIAITVSFVLPIISAIYLKDISTLISTVYFASVIIATYLGIQSGIILGIAQILMVAPVYRFNVEFIFVSIIGVFVCSIIAGRKTGKFNSASLILVTSVACVAASISYNLVVKSPRSVMLASAIWAVISATVAVVAAIGSMPIFELISNTVSPVRLIDLSQPGNPLLKRLFLEAPGTSQHSMMVANLSDSAADAIGADALLAKVGAYYHDIGKLENPSFFSENQQDGYNPHDEMPPAESTAIIIAHPENGVRLARKNRLPGRIIKIIQEHHGTTCQIFFYHKAKSIAEKNGMPVPSIDDFRYKGGIPSSKESAIVMLADTCEAALRSTGISNLDEAEDLFRKLFKQKIEQDQLTDSGLSFNDLEKILQAFLQVYAGFFHERIQYPDDSTIRK